MKKITSLFLSIMLLFSLTSCGQTSNSSTIPNQIIIGSIYNSYIKTIDNAQEIEKLWNSYKSLKLEKTDAELELSSVYTIDFLFSGKNTSERVLLDKNGTLWVNGDTQSYAQTENVLNYTEIKSIFENQKGK